VLLRLDPNANRGVQPARRLAVRKHGRVELVSLDDVVYIRGADHYTELVLRNGRRELYDKSLEKLAALLPGDF
jgi:two-component system response regulator LytT